MVKSLRFALLFLLLLIPASLPAEWGVGGCSTDLMQDLMIVDKVNRALEEQFPVYYNHLLYGGYFNMPSARMGKEGDIGIGYSSVPPYDIYGVRLQFMDRVEISGNYRVFRGIDDPLLSSTGFGDMADKGANLKIALMHPEDTNYLLPGIAIGWEDFIGTKSFDARYIVATQVFPKYNFEFSLGYGQKRIRKWFGGITWLPFRCYGHRYLKDFALVAEYDAIPYKSEKREPHPDGRNTSSDINYGIKYRLWDKIDLSASCIRGEEFAYSVGLHYNFGMTEGFFPKILDPLPYSTPRNLQPLGPLRPCDALVQDLLYPFREQGLDLNEIWISVDRCGRKILTLYTVNFTYRYEDEVRRRLNPLFANLIPSDISEVIVIMDNDFMELQEYRFQMDFVRAYGENCICPYELYVLTPMREATKPPCSSSSLLFRSRKDLCNFEIYPKTYTAFGSAKGKFKYLFGVHLGISGFVLNDWFYSVVLGYGIWTKLYDVRDVDKLNPSQIINVRTDSVNYYKQEGITVDEAYFQRDWNLGCGFFGRVALGLFEEAYGGVATEFLYYPVNSNWAVGIEGAYLRKRTYSGIGFSDEVRKLEGYQPTFRKYHGSQYFAKFYYNFDCLDMDVSLKAGRFLAHDWGVRTELARYYPSGMRFFFWYTYTDAKDFVNGNRYQDHGVGISLPLDIFYLYSTRTRVGYAMSAWLRDVGACAATGLPLYYHLRDNRERSIQPINRCTIW